MKKIFALLLVVAMMLSIAACGSSNSTSNSQASSSAAPSAAAASESSQTAQETTKDPSDIYSWILEENPDKISGTVRFWVPFKGEQGMDSMISEFNKTYPNIKVELNTYNNNAEGNTAVNTAMLAGQIDVLHSFELYNAYARWENGLYKDLTDIIKEEGIDLLANWGDDTCTYNGKVYTLPAGGQSYYIAINKNAWDKAGLGEIPTSWTWDEYIEASRKMTSGDGNDKVFGGSSYQAINTVYNTMYQVYGKNAFYHEDGTSSADDSVIIKALKRQVDAENEKIWFPLTSYRYDGATTHQTFLTGKAASTVTCNITRFLTDTKSYPVDFVTVFAPWPTEEKGQTNYMEGISTFSHVGISSQCNMDNYDAIYAFLKWYSTYGCKYLAIAGHMPTWKGTEASGMVDLVFGSEDAAKKLADVESYKRVICNFSGNNHKDTELTAYSKLNSLMQEYIMYAHSGEKTPEQALSELKVMQDEAIKEAKK